MQLRLGMLDIKFHNRPLTFGFVLAAAVRGARTSAGFSRPHAVQRLAATEGGCSAARRCADQAEK